MKTYQTAMMGTRTVKMTIASLGRVPVGLEGVTKASPNALSIPGFIFPTGEALS